MVAGHYLLVEGSSGQFFSRALVTTPVLGPTGPSCQVQFYYHMFGVNAGKKHDEKCGFYW
ncbi:hypothetical protein DPMN_011731 [Dreissena polymorpha]|uniref:MAM domain-containing protein n=1 Tax=Dreissena polymorpha TaxID=45954 RepID=A0A9D4N6Q2_DREPO|nr:hypothetical protein DPMN_011731 [Dreissena polymorpha]